MTGEEIKKDLRHIEKEIEMLQLLIQQLTQDVNNIKKTEVSLNVPIQETRTG